MDPMQISRTGLDVEWRRMEVIAANLANLNTTRTALGEPYQPLRLVSGPRMDFNAHLAAGAGLTGVQVYGVEPTTEPARRVYEPSHPHADADGYVRYPALDHATEMTLLLQTARAYEANLMALSAGRQMYAKALEIGRR
ncbi:flagellar basal body rod protein FlgC [Brevundimonas sp.]|uniref:flagellar basal body rod protein FlgC n=1 Tax=Brevundimonas sp. TaxID=1871086 RepID=UPI002D2B30C1|nr:flagellar basal body rod protein FlgC [Brevundimonas sp.]HYC68874.1 flagellar basal body rod protein FlgC [Brevundimonas sp.]